jgi:chromosome segregation ATPase
MKPLSLIEWLKQVFYLPIAIQHLRKELRMGVDDIVQRLEAADQKLDEQAARIAGLEESNAALVAQQAATIAQQAADNTALTEANASLTQNVADLKAQIAAQDQAVQDALAPSLAKIDADVDNFAAIGATPPPTT